MLNKAKELNDLEMNIVPMKLYSENHKKYLYFGKYPNEVVQSKKLIKKLKRLKPEDNIYKFDGKEYIKQISVVNGAGDIFENIDIVWENGKPKTKVNTSQVYFSNMKKIKDKQEYFFELSPIKWVVLSQNKDRLILQSNEIIDCKIFDEDTNKYEESKMRQWLNEDFFDLAFSKKEKEQIILSENDNGILSNDVFGGTIGDMTGLTNIIRVNERFYNRTNSNDYVFLPSFRDVHNEEYGFYYSSSKSESRIKNSSDFALACGLNVGKNGRSSWWTRSSIYDYERYRVTSMGSIHYSNVSVNVVGISPCIVIKGNRFEYSENKSIYRSVLDNIVASTITEINGTDERVKPTLKVKQRYICFGKYPQSVVDDQEIIKKLNRNKNGSYFKLQEGEFVSQMSNTYNQRTVFSNRVRVEPNHKYYFKRQPILWKILKETDDSYILQSHFLLDVMKFDELSTEYDDSMIRQNLNNSFLDFTFDEYERSVMLPIYKNDFITIPSSDFLQTNVHGYPHLGSNSYTRMRRVTDFSKCIGIYETDYMFLHNGYSYWWLRTSSMKDSVEMVFDDGAIGNRKPNKVAVGVCPMIKIRKSNNQIILQSFNELKSLDEFEIQLIGEEDV